MASPAAPPVSAVRRVSASQPRVRRLLAFGVVPLQTLDRVVDGVHVGGLHRLVVRHLVLPSGRVALAGWGHRGGRRAMRVRAAQSDPPRDGCRPAVPHHSAPTDGTRPLCSLQSAIVIAHIWPCQGARTMSRSAAGGGVPADRLWTAENAHRHRTPRRPTHMTRATASISGRIRSVVNANRQFAAMKTPARCILAAAHDASTAMTTPTRQQRPAQRRAPDGGDGRRRQARRRLAPDGLARDQRQHARAPRDASSACSPRCASSTTAPTPRRARWSPGARGRSGS